MPRLAAALVGAGMALVLAGMVLWAARGLGLGHLPGDIALGRGRVRVYAPLATSLLVSVLATLVLNLVLRR